MSKVRVLAIPSDKHGVGKFRIIDPFTFIGDNHSSDVHVDLVFDVPNRDDFFDNYDVVIFHTLIHRSNHEDNIKRLKWLKSVGKTIVMDTDDYWRVDQRHPMYETFKSKNLAGKRVEMLRLSDYVTCTTNLYRDKLISLLNHDRVHVFPNAVNEEENQFKVKPIKSSKVRFGWLGGSSHLHDIELMKGGISQMHRQYKDKVQFVLCGFDLRGNMREINKVTGQVNERPIRPEETVWTKYEGIFTDDYKTLDTSHVDYLKRYSSEPFLNELDKPYVRRWTLDINKYATNYNYFDVSLAPLVKSEFNGYKSQLKVIEAGFHKKPIIATAENPYLIDLIDSYDRGTKVDNGNSLLVQTSKNHKQWFQQMKRLVESPSLREELGEKLYETVKDKYSLKKVCQDRVEFLKTINKN